jgi:hypothetical protein
MCDELSGGAEERWSGGAEDVVQARESVAYGTH